MPTELTRHWYTLQEIKGQAEKGAFDPVASFKPLNACCESRNPELISLAIGCLSELMEFGHLKVRAHTP